MYLLDSKSVWMLCNTLDDDYDELDIVLCLLV
jgi:hypothetical protein